jgi:iron complex outermembrane receptor protein
VQTWQTQIENTLCFNTNITLQTGFDFQYFAAQVDGYGAEIKQEKRSSLFALLRYQPNSKLNISANFRQAFIEGFSPSPTPSLGLDYQVFSNSKNIVTLKTNFSYAYRVPTLNERFWKNSGNPNLQPEMSHSGEIGLQHQFITKKWNFYNNITYYNSLVDNWILWKQGANFWYPENLLQVNAKGLEISTKISYTSTNFSVLGGLQYQFTQSILVKSTLPEEQDKQLSYIPLHTSGVFGLLQYKRILLNFSTNYLGKRFTTTDNLNFLPAYFLTNLSVGYQHNFKPLRKSQEKTSLSLWFRIYNLTNETYQNVEAKAMPLRNYTVSLQFSF